MDRLVYKDTFEDNELTLIEEADAFATARTSNALEFQEVHAMREAVSALLPEKAYTIETGARFGHNSLYWYKRNNVAFMLIYEPRPKCLPLLLENLRLNKVPSDSALVYNLVMSDEPGKWFNLTIEDSYTKNYSLKELGTAPIYADNNTFVSQSVDFAIEHTINTHKPVDLLVINQPGCEYKIAEGAKKCLQKHSPIVVAVCGDVNDMLTTLQKYNKRYELKEFWPINNMGLFVVNKEKEDDSNNTEREQAPAKRGRPKTK